MQSELLIPWVLAVPFEPFSAFVADGRKIDITHPEVATLAKYAIALHVYHPAGELETIDIDRICSMRSMNPTDSKPYAE